MAPRNTFEIVRSQLVLGDGGCWLWPNSLSPSGYGQVRFDDRQQVAHRVMYEQLHGPVPEGYELHHVCGIRRCANPIHVVAVTRAQHRRLDAARVSECPYGHPYSPENTRFRDNNASRVCRTCERKRSREYAKQRYWSDSDYRKRKCAA